MTRTLDAPFLAMVFSATMDTIETKRMLCKKFRTAIIPTPREISKSCGFAIRIDMKNEKELMEAVKVLDVPYEIYRMGAREAHGRVAELIVGREMGSSQERYRKEGSE
ncbi:MAG: DUF3343 domain-containing protein [Anaerovoracaceae bacterium]|nr:DUF3343 domain-containing protein [Anaerovoracaceae bacterium]